MRNIKPWSRWAVVLLCTSPALARPTAFPGSDALASPDRKLEVLSVPPDNNESRHRLIVKSLANGEQRTLLAFTRHVDVQWSPDGSALAITDYSASNRSDCLIATHDGHVLSAWTASEAFVHRTLQENHHAFLRCKKWTDNHTVAVELTAYGDIDPKGVKKRLLFSLDGRVRVP